MIFAIVPDLILEGSLLNMSIPCSDALALIKDIEFIAFANCAGSGKGIVRSINSVNKCGSGLTNALLSIIVWLIFAPGLATLLPVTESIKYARSSGK